MTEWDEAVGPPCPACGREMLQVMSDGRCKTCWQESVHLQDKERENAQDLLEQIGPLITPRGRRFLRQIAAGRSERYPRAPKNQKE